MIAPVPPGPTDDPPGPALPDETDTPARATDAQKRKLFALLRDAGLTAHDERLAWANQHLDRPISSSADLTPAEASQLIDTLENATEPPQGGAP